MTVILTVEGDELDLLLSEHYGPDRVSAALAAVHRANIGLAAQGFRPAAGTRIVLPDLPAAGQRRVQLWS